MAGRFIALIRHGDYQQLQNTPSAHQPFGLTDDGFEQARAGVTELRSIMVDNAWALSPTVFSSNLLRGWQTAQVFAEGLGAGGVEGFDDLAERGLGSAANLALSEIEAILDADPRFDVPPSDWKSDSHYCLPLQGAESLMDAGERVAARLTAIAKTMVDRDHDTLAVVVGHGAAFRHAAHKLGVLSFGDIAKLSMTHGRPVILEVNEQGSWCHVAGAWKQRTIKDINLD